MKTSIIIPCWNSAATLKQCLEAIFALDKDGRDVEVMVVDDASTDATVSIARQYPCRVVKLASRKGAGHARNRGVEAAGGDLIVFTDSDVILPANTLRLIWQALEKQEICVGVCSAENPHQGFFSQYKSLYLSFKYQEATGGSAFCTTIAALPKQLFTELGGFNERLTACEDNDLGNRLLKSGHPTFVEHGLEVLHLKRFGLKSLLVNDFKKASALGEIFFSQTKEDKVKVKGGFADIGGQMILNVPLAYLCLAAGVWFVVDPRWLAGLALGGSLLVVVSNNYGFLLFVGRRKGWMFALASFIYSAVNYIVVGIAVLFGGARVYLRSQ